MADNVTLNAGSGGDTIAADDVSGVKYQVVKLAVGADGAASLVANANPIPVSDAGGSLTVDGTVGVSGTVTVDASGATVPVSNAGLTELAAAINGSSQLDVNIAASAATLTVDDGGASLTVDGAVSLKDSLGADISIDNPLPVDAFYPGTLDSFGTLVTGEINNAVDIQFYRDTPANLTTVTTGTGGSATATGGMATFAATTSANSFAKGVSLTSVVYSAGAEIYALFTAAFTAAGSGTSYERIGIYDTNDGFFIGYEGATFGVTIRKGGSDTQTAKASWNKDTLVGGATSRFRRGASAEAIDLTKLNVWRIRFGWVGSAPIEFEVLSPNGEWVTFHQIRQPNLAALPSLENADLPITCNVNSGDSGIAISILTNCWCAGTTAKLTKINSTLTTSTLAGLTRAVITGETTGGGGAFVNVKVTPSGTMSVDASGTAVPVTDDSGSLTVDAPVETPVFVRLSDGAAAITTLPVSLASVPSHAVTNAGTFAVQVDGAALTALQLIDDPVATLGTTTYTETTTKGMIVGAVRRDADTTLVDTTNEIGPLQMDANGRLKVEVFSGETLPVSGTVTANLAAGTNNIGDVDVLTVPTDPFGANADAASATGSISAKLRFIASTGIPITGTVTVGSHAVTNAGTFATQVDGAALTALQLIDNASIADDAAFTPATTGVTMAGFFADEASTDPVDEGDGGAARMTLDRKQIVTPYAHAGAGGATPFYNLDVDETEDAIKATAGKLYALGAINRSTGVRYLKLYNATTASVTVGTTTPVLVIPLPTMADTNGAGVVLPIPSCGIQFDTAITIAATTGFADNDTGAPGANDVIAFGAYL